MDPLLTALLGLFGLLALVFVLTSASLYAAARILGFSGTGFRKAMKATGMYLSFLIVLLLAFFASTLFFVGASFLVIPFSLLVLALAVASFIYIIMHVYEVDWRHAFLAFLIYYGINAVLGGIVYFILAGFIVTWQMAVLNAADSSGVTYSGWGGLVPIASSVSYGSDGLFEASFKNMRAAQLNITGVYVTDQGAGLSCAAARTGKDSAAALEGLKVKATCQPKEKGEPYQLEIRVDYVTVDRGIRTEVKESGRIKGSVE